MSMVQLTTRIEDTVYKNSMYPGTGSIQNCSTKTRSDNQMKERVQKYSLMI